MENWTFQLQIMTDTTKCNERSLSRSLCIVDWKDFLHLLFLCALFRLSRTVSRAQTSAGKEMKSK